MSIFSQVVFVIARITPNGAEMLGTGFLVSPDGLIATAHHVIGSGSEPLAVLMNDSNSLDDYQDLTNTRANWVSCEVKEIDPLRDIALVKAGLTWDGPLPSIGSFDETKVGQTLETFGYPHVNEGRKALTYMKAELGAKVLTASAAPAVKVKHGIINTQARPGQSGSPIINPVSGAYVGILSGAWAAATGPVLMIGALDPRELHQTTHCVSAEYIKEML